MHGYPRKKPKPSPRILLASPWARKSRWAIRRLAHDAPPPLVHASLVKAWAFLSLGVSGSQLGEIVSSSLGLIVIELACVARQSLGVVAT